jgi:hypothetical protein
MSESTFNWREHLKVYPAADGPESPPPDRRIIKIAERFSLALPLARVVVELALGERAAR